LATLAALSIARVARADGAPSCPPIEGGSIVLSALDTDLRLSFIRATLHDQASRE
jgi:hypothetical protein